MSLAVFPSDPSFGGSATPQPDQQSSYSVKPRINVVAFGDGYSQRTPDGLNTLRRVFSFSWKNIYSSQKVTIENFLIQQGGYIPFLYQPPTYSSQIQFTCAQWKFEFGEYNLFTLTATFEENFDIPT
jgi:phage-related protein